MKKVSVIIPARNTGNIISDAINSILSQNYEGTVEIIVADGSDDASTFKIIENNYLSSVEWIANPGLIVSTGLNRAIKLATGDIIVRCDAQSILPEDYISKAVETIERTGAAVVGGMQIIQGKTSFEKAMGVALKSSVGSGNSRYKTGGYEGETDTVYLGVFKREILEKTGGYDEKLDKNQDYELNWRIRQLGEKIWFNPDMYVYYKPRSNIFALIKQYFNYGRWKGKVLRRTPKMLKIRQLGPPVLVLGLIASILLHPFLTAMILTIYVGLILSETVWHLIKTKNLAMLYLPFIFMAMHFSWGVGFFVPVRSPKLIKTLLK